MMDFDDFGGPVSTKPLSQAEKAAAVLLAMGKGVAGKLLKYFTQSELQTIIASAQTLREIPPDELLQLVNEFEDLFTEGAGLMDNARAIEGILEEGLTPEEVDSLLGRRTAFQAYETSIWDRLQDADPNFVGKFLLREHPQTIAYILSMLPSSFGAKVLLQLPENRRADIVNRTVNMKDVSPKAAQIIENRVMELIQLIEAERNSNGSNKVAELMNELEKPRSIPCSIRWRQSAKNRSTRYVQRSSCSKTSWPCRSAAASCCSTTSLATSSHGAAWSFERDQGMCALGDQPSHAA